MSTISVPELNRSDAIVAFSGDNAFLSNFSPSPITLHWPETAEGSLTCMVPTVEHGYQASKCLLLADAIQVCEVRRPYQAKRLGRLHQARPNWEEIKLDVMKHLLWAKFAPGQELRRQLLATEGRMLIEGNDWGDDFWGMVPTAEGLQGENHLGRILMEIRDS